ncbi:MAG: 30S ribosomal protein S20 [Candidatus Levybacteria bacterium]|nr:30S ribosomal protein S20 [Candidatus Levybacteria bacterium]
MPVIKSAIKKLRQDKKREKQNDDLREILKSTVRAAKKTKTGKSVSKAVSIVDKAAKNKIIHQNKASRIKASLSRLAKPQSGKSSQKVSSVPKKVAPKKKVTKPTKAK